MKTLYRGKLWGRDSLSDPLGELFTGEEVAAQLPTSFPSASCVLQNSHCTQWWARQLVKRSSGSPLGHLSIGPGLSLCCLRPEGLFDFPKIQGTPFPWALSGPPLLSSLFPLWICEMWTSSFPWHVPFEMAFWWGLGRRHDRIARLAGMCSQLILGFSMECWADITWQCVGKSLEVKQWLAFF